MKGGEVFRVLIFGLPFIFLNNGIKTWLVVQNKTHFYLFSMALIIFLSVLLNVIFIEKFGLLGAALSFFLSWFIGGFVFFGLFNQTRDLSRELFVSFLFPFEIFKELIRRR